MVSSERTMEPDKLFLASHSAGIYICAGTPRLSIPCGCNICRQYTALHAGGFIRRLCSIGTFRQLFGKVLPNHHKIRMELCGDMDSPQLPGYIRIYCVRVDERTLIATSKEPRVLYENQVRNAVTWETRRNAPEGFLSTLCEDGFYRRTGIKLGIDEYVAFDSSYPMRSAP